MVRRNPNWPPPDWPAQSVAFAEAYFESEMAIRARRRTLTLTEATAVVREEFARRSVPITAHRAEGLARTFLRPLWWPFMHPRAARREGYRVDWPWSRDT